MTRKIRIYKSGKVVEVPFTKIRALKLCREQWNRLAKLKYLFLRFDEKYRIARELSPEVIENSCFCCEYSGRMGNHIDCHRCPLLNYWNDGKELVEVKDECEHKQPSTWYPCEEQPNSPYRKWRDTGSPIMAQKIVSYCDQELARLRGKKKRIVPLKMNDDYHVPDLRKIIQDP